MLLLSAPCPGASRGVPDVHDSHRVTENPREDFEWIANKRYDSHAGPPLDAGRPLRKIGNIGYNVSDARFECGGHSIAKLSAAITRNLAQVTNRQRFVNSTHH